MINPMDLQGKNILVTGASSGIGRATSIHLSRLGANVILMARNKIKLQETMSCLKGGKHAFYSFDISQIELIDDIMNLIISDGYVLDGLVHSAGISYTMPLRSLKYEDICRVMMINFYSFVELSKTFSKKGNYRENGSIVGISSVLSSIGMKGCTAYCASKSAMDGAIRAMALELVPKKIRVNSVAPSWIETDMHQKMGDLLNDELFVNLEKRQPMGLGQPVDIANAIAFLLSDASKFITGTKLNVDGGYLVQ